MDRNTNTNTNANVPKVSRKWSEEAVRGSVQSSLFRASSTSPASEEEPQPEDDTNPNLIDEWLSHQEPSDPSTVLDAVSELTTPLSSPMTSFGSPTFETPAGLSRPTMDTLMPPSTSASTSTTKLQKKNPRKRPREPTVDSTENDLLGVGAFAEGQRPRQKMKYKPLSNWFNLWLPNDQNEQN